MGTYAMLQQIYVRRETLPTPGHPALIRQVDWHADNGYGGRIVGLFMLFEPFKFWKAATAASDFAIVRIWGMGTGYMFLQPLFLLKCLVAIERRALVVIVRGLHRVLKISLSQGQCRRDV